MRRNGSLAGVLGCGDGGRDEFMNHEDPFFRTNGDASQRVN